MKASKRDALMIAIIYGMISVIWIIFSDWFFFTISNELEEMAFFSIIKGLGFVLLSAFIIYVLVERRLRFSSALEETLKSQGETIQTQKDSLEKLQSLTTQTVRSLPFPTFIYRSTGEILALSEGFKQSLECSDVSIPTLNRLNYLFYSEVAHFSIEYLTDIKSKIHVHDGLKRMVAKSGEPIYVDWHTTYLGTDTEGYDLFIQSGMDMTKEVKKEQTLTFKSYHDVLTGVFNRRYYHEYILNHPDEVRLLIIADINGLKLINDVFGHHEGDKLLKHFADILKSHLPKNTKIIRLGGDEFVAAVDETSLDLSTTTTAIKHAFENKRADLVPCVAIGYANIRKNEPIETAFTRAENRLYKDKIHENNKQTDAMVVSLKRALLERTDETHDHLKNLENLAIPTAKELGLHNRYINDLKQLIDLHDIGKISVDEAVFNNNGALSDQQRKDIRRHPEIGYRIANALPRLQNVAYAILTHHENADGSGYPFGLKQEDIPIIARILRVVDSYETMRRDSHYSAAMPKEKAIEELNRLKNTYYDESVVDAFVKTIH